MSLTTALVALLSAILAMPACSPQVGGTSTQRPSPARVGGQLGPGGVARFYHTDLRFPTKPELTSARSGARVVLTFKADPMATIRGAFDGRLRVSAEKMSSAGGDWLIGYWHEPEDDMLPSLYREAFRHVAAVLHPFPHVRTIAVLMASTFTHGDGLTWYPGDGAVDVLGVDGYNWEGCRSNGGLAAPGATARSFGQIFAAADVFARAHGIPMLVAEFGTPASPTNPRARTVWLAAAGRWMAAHPELLGAWYFDLGRRQGFLCEWTLGPAARAEYRSLSTGGGVDPNPTGNPGTGPATPGGSP
jgi:hypothetical protein